MPVRCGCLLMERGLRLNSGRSRQGLKALYRGIHCGQVLRSHWLRLARGYLQRAVRVHLYINTCIAIQMYGKMYGI